MSLRLPARWLALLLLAPLLSLPLATCGPTPSVDACGVGLLPQRFSLSWEKVNHRVSLLGFGTPILADLPCPALPGQAAIAIKGGDWSTGQTMKDTPRVEAFFYAVDARRDGDHPAAAFVRTTNNYTLGPQGDSKDHRAQVSDTLVFDLAALKIEGYQRYVPAIIGYRLDTGVKQPQGYPGDYDPGHGYTLSLLEIKLGEPVRAGSRIQIPLTASIGWGPSDRRNMNAALKLAVTAVRVDVALIGLDGHTTQWSKSYKLAYGTPELGKELNQPPATEEQKRLLVQGRSGFQHAVPIWQTIRHELTGDKYVGFYIRTLRDSVKLLSHDPANGAVTLDVDGYAGTSSVIDFHRLTHAYEAAGQVLQLNARSVRTAGTSGDAAIGDTLMNLEMK